MVLCVPRHPVRKIQQRESPATQVLLSAEALGGSFKINKNKNTPPHPKWAFWSRRD